MLAPEIAASPIVTDICYVMLGCFGVTVMADLVDAESGYGMFYTKVQLWKILLVAG